MANSKTYAQLYQKALDAGKSRDYDLAVQILEKLVSETDTIPEALLYLGRSYHALKNYEKSISVYKHFIANVPDESAGYFFLGRTYLSLKLYEYAVHYLRKAYDRDPENIQILSFLGLAYLRIKRPELASAILGAAVELGDVNKRIYNAYLNALSVHAVKEFYAGNFDLALQMFQFLLDKGYESEFVYVYLGLLAREKGDYIAALRYYNSALEFSPDDIGLKIRQAAMLYMTGSKTEAVKQINALREVSPFISDDFFNQSGMLRSLCIHHFNNNEYKKAVYFGNQALKENYSDPVIHGIIGEAHRIGGNFEKAENHFTRSLESSPDSTEIRYGLAMLYWQKGQYNLMLKELKRILTREPENQSVQFFIVLCKCRLEYSTEQTIPLVQETIKRFGPDPYMFSALGEQYVRGGLDTLASKWFEKAVQIYPQYRDAYEWLIHLYSSQDLDSDLERTFSAFFLQFPEDKKTRKDYIIFLVAKKKFGDAIEQILKYLPYRTNDEKTKRLLAMCYRKNGQYRDALILYKELILRSPSSEEYIKALVFCYEKIGNITFAVSFLTQVVKELQPSLSLLLIFGSLLYKSGDEEKSLQVFREAADAVPSDSRAYYNISVIYKNKGMTDMSNKFKIHAEEIEKKAVG